MKTKFLIRLLVMTFYLQCCTSVEPGHYGSIKRNAIVESIEGKYEIFPSERPDPKPIHTASDNFIHLIQNTNFKKRMKLDSNKHYAVELKFTSSSRLKVLVLKEDEVVETKTYKVDFLRDGFLQLANETRLVGFPYIFGTHASSTTRIGINEDHDLIWNISEFHGGGALIFIFLNWFKTEQYFLFKRIS